MEFNNLYSFVLMIVLVGMLIGVGLVVLSNFGTASGVSVTAAKSINNTMDALSPIATTWLPLIVTVSVLAIILTLVIRSFGGGAR